MNKGAFYRMIQSKGKVEARLTEGYIEDGIGVYKEGSKYKATHIKTGRLFVIPFVATSFKEMFAIVKKHIENTQDFDELIQMNLLSLKHDMFLESIKEQEEKEE